MSKVFTVVIGIVLTTGWYWADYLIAEQKITTTQRFWGLVVLTILLVVEQIYLGLPDPSTRGMVDSRRILIENYLRLLLQQYEEWVTESLEENEELPKLRINIMLPTKHLRGILPWLTHLKIYYSACSQGTSYSISERELSWRKKQGNCGWAWRHEEISLYTAGDQPQSVFKMNENQEKQTGSINSILSLPIWHNEVCIGILNLDSEKRSVPARLAAEDIQKKADAVANAVAGHLFPDGIAA
jgi:hypothetical protein